MSSIQEGDTGQGVKDVQTLLTKRGYPVEVTGDFGPETLAAVRAFQSQNLDPHGQPLTVDGKVGPLTLWSLTHPKPDVPTQSAVDFTEMPPESAGGSAKGRKALEFAIAELKAGAGEVGGDNRGPFVRKYLGPAKVPEGSSWCASFVSWCLLQASDGVLADMPVPYSAGARKLLAEFQSNGWAHTPESGYSPLPGDLVFWWRVSANGWQGHVGFVYELKDGYLYTIEGNKSPRVQGFSYVKSRMEQLLGFGSIP
ncbi:MAG TPA: peptidoglycan-binding protein [Polyangiaceae bacterium]|nr:peptidoglycan-binding protein [Polyangiaceae bacterium]